MYVKKEDFELLLDVLEIVDIYGSKELIKRYEAFIDKVCENRAKAIDSGAESMRRFRKRNPEKARENNIKYLRSFRERKKNERRKQTQ